jgi:hypothetical protein
MIFMPRLASVCSPIIALLPSVYHFSPCGKTDLSMSAVSVHEAVLPHNWSLPLYMLLSTDQCAVHSKNTMVLRKQNITFKVITPTNLYFQPLIRMALQSMIVQVIMYTAKMTMHWNLLKVKKLIGIVSVHRTSNNAVEVYRHHNVNQMFEPAPDLARTRIRRQKWQTITLWMQ